MDRRRLLFICTENSARSLMAEALLVHLAGDQFEVVSAGTHPGSPHPLALQCLEDAGLDTHNLHSKPLRDCLGAPWDYVITLCDKASRECQELPFAGQVIAWDFPDPAATNTLASFTRVMKEIRERLQLFVMVHQKSTRPAPTYPPAQIFKVLGDNNRLAIMLMIARKQELCVCELTSVLEISQPRVSRCLAQLKDLSLLSDERRGQWVYYQLHPNLPAWILALLRTTEIARDPELAPLLRASVGTAGPQTAIRCR